MDSLNVIAEAFRGKRVLIAGFGREGKSTFRILRTVFPDMQVGIADRDASNAELQGLGSDSKVRLHLGEEYLSSLQYYDVIVKSPGIPYWGTPLAECRHKITSQTDLFFKACPGTIIGVTGTKGKSTCASLVYSLLDANGSNVHLLGNIGHPALDSLDSLGDNPLVVYELSSHQLADVTSSPHISVLLNVFPEHLDYYENVSDYIQAKMNIVGHAGAEDVAIYNASFDAIAQAVHACAAKPVPYVSDGGDYRVCWSDGEQILFSAAGRPEPVISLAEVRLPGAFNTNNIIPAVIVGKLLDVPTSTIRHAIRRFKGIEHRLEFVGTYNGVEFYDDSISTIPECTLAALSCFQGRVGSIILGGHDRRRTFNVLARALLDSPPEAIVLFPKTGDAVHQALHDESRGRGLSLNIPVYQVDNMDDAVRLCFENTSPGNVCLLSPASPSFGLFKDYVERGAMFKECVRRRGGDGKQE